jgi:hypothetical protein
MIVLLVLGVLLFGKRLPELGRTLGWFIVEFQQTTYTQRMEVILFAVLVLFVLALSAYLWLKPG